MSDSGNDRDEENGLPFWKTSELAFLFHGVSPPMKEAASVNTTGGMERLATDANVRLF